MTASFLSFLLFFFRGSKAEEDAAVNRSRDDQSLFPNNNKRRRKKRSKLLDSTAFKEALEPRQAGMDKPVKPVPVYRQRPGESEEQFMDRVEKSTKVRQLPLLEQSCCAQTTDMNLGQAHCLASRAPTLDLCLEITRSRTFVIQGFI